MRLDRPDEAAVTGADVDAATSAAADAGTLLIDKWQFVPKILGAVKRAVDSDDRPGQFLLTGSAGLGPAGWAMALASAFASTLIEGNGQ